MKLGAGWLPNDDTVPTHIWGVFIPIWSEREQAPFPTRRWEYAWAANRLHEHSTSGLVVDAGAGFNDEIHLMPRIMAQMGFDVVAVDANVASLVMRPVQNVVRFHGDITRLPNLDATCDVWSCISTLEHMSQLERVGAVREAFRILKPGGIAIATADEYEPAELNDLFRTQGFEAGEVELFFGQHLAPRVAWCVSRKGG